MSNESENKSFDTDGVEEKTDAENRIESDFSECVSDETKSENQNVEELTSVDAFLSSLDEIGAQSDPSAPQKKKKKRKKIELTSGLRIFLIALFLGIFVISLYMIISTLVDGYTSDKINSQLTEEFFSDVDRTDLMSFLKPALIDTPTPEFFGDRGSMYNKDYTVKDTNNPLIEQYKQNLLELKEKNSEIFGWIQVDGTNISYACVKGNDNQFYLDHTATKEFNVHGAIFADYACKDAMLDNANLVLYGHNSSFIGQMFSQVKKFLDKSFFEANRYITIYTVDGIYKYEIFSVYQTHAGYNYTQLLFTSEDSFVDWCNEIESNSLHHIDGEDFMSGTRILTLSTCTGAYVTERYSLHARLVSVEK